MRKLFLLLVLTAGIVKTQTGPPVVLYVVSPTVSVIPPVTPTFDFAGMGLLVHRLPTDTLLSVDITYSDNSIQTHLIKIKDCSCSGTQTWKIGAYIGLKQALTVSKITYSILTPGTPQDGGIAK